ncbi:signal recognition particle receptor subunit alpha-like isoform X2 [Acipenser ruthenus]|uniref:signal recognition particle receptor subunit alpha-like isoform X2 n=1 Tax=Acipenser ruthenus TaxID=7906 RepID=UPI00274296AD|nr:signal recognition particle receptor subunit alpha-like isoform X2 [Acipenser ruthenus]
MLDFFTIFSKGGLVLWCFQGVNGSFTGPVNALIRSVILQERSGSNLFTHDALSLKYKLDNEFELVFVVGFQKILTLTYVDKFLDDVQLRFRDRYKNQLEQKGAMKLLNGSFQFQDDFQQLLREAEESTKACAPAPMKTFKQSQKSQKTVKSMIETRGGEKGKEKESNKKSKNAKKEASAAEGDGDSTRGGTQSGLPKKSSPKPQENGNEGLTPEEIKRNQQEFFRRMGGGGAKKPSSSSSSKSPKPEKLQRVKGNREWVMGGTNTKELDYSNKDMNGSQDTLPASKDNAEDLKQLGQMKGDLRSVDYESSEEEEEDEEVVVSAAAAAANPSKSSSKSFRGVFGMLKGLVGSKSLSQEDMEPVLDKLRDHLIAKNVAADIASKLCESVAKKLEGKVMGTFTTVTSTVKQALQDSLVQILQPKRRVDILRDVMEARAQRRPFVVTFCGVNGVGKSTNLAKISFWLIENGFSVLIAACDTFRAGAVEQLRTHQRRLNSMHPPEENGGRPRVQLYEKGYGKDAAGIAMEAIAYARSHSFDVVLVDTAGRMQDNAPLMVALAKLIAVNMPDLVLFVGEALVGNEAVDQLVKFNQALADHSMSDKPRIIDGIVLTKFDTIDDKVGAAISMTYITGQPIVFVGTGQTYSDLRSLNARAVVSALMKA